MKGGVKRMDCCDLGSFLDALVCGTNLHISVVFAGKPGSGKMRRAYHHVVHRKPICIAMRKNQEGVNSCIRCRMTVQNYIIRHGKPMSGYCAKGVFEYCAPVLYRGEVIAVIFIGNIYTGAQEQKRRFGESLTPQLLETMEHRYSPADCANTAEVISSYIRMLADRYGLDDENNDSLMESIKSYIRDNYTYDFSVSELAEMFGYNAKYLGRLFKNRTGTTINAFCNTQRIIEAKKLLSETDMRITDIALHTGFNNISYFNYVFFQHTGVSPSVYRSAETQRK